MAGRQRRHAIRARRPHRWEQRHECDDARHGLGGRGVTALQRALHWVMAACILAMLFIGVGMVSTVSQRYLALVSIHKPLGIAILALVLVRIVVRLRYGAPALPADLPEPMKLAAHLSHYAFYALMLAMPLIGWGDAVGCGLSGAGAWLYAAGDPAAERCVAQCIVDGAPNIGVCVFCVGAAASWGRRCFISWCAGMACSRRWGRDSQGSLRF